jgi:hypothetical protein
VSTSSHSHFSTLSIPGKISRIISSTAVQRDAWVSGITLGEFRGCLIRYPSLRVMKIIKAQAFRYCIQISMVCGSTAHACAVSGFGLGGSTRSTRPFLVSSVPRWCVGQLLAQPTWKCQVTIAPLIYWMYNKAFIYLVAVRRPKLDDHLLSGLKFRLNSNNVLALMRNRSGLGFTFRPVHI